MSYVFKQFDDHRERERYRAELALQILPLLLEAGKNVETPTYKEIGEKVNVFYHSKHLEQALKWTNYFTYGKWQCFPSVCVVNKKTKRASDGIITLFSYLEGTSESMLFRKKIKQELDTFQEKAPKLSLEGIGIEQFDELFERYED